MDRDTVQFGKLSTRMVLAGAYAGLTGAEASTLVVIAANLNGATWSAKLTVPGIAKMAGLNERSVRRGLRGLESRGVIQTDRSPGGNASRYTLVTDPDTTVRVVPGHPCPGTDLPTRTPRVINPDAQGHQPGHPGSSTRTVVSPYSDVQISQQQQAAGSVQSEPTTATDNQEPGDAVIAALTASGVAEPKRSELAELFRDVNGAPRLIADTAARLRDSGKRTGVLILELQSIAEARAMTDQERAACDERARQRKMLDEEHDAKVIQEREAVTAIIGALSKADLAKFEAKARSAANTFEARCWEGKTVHDYYPLKLAVAALARKAGPCTGTPADMGVE